MSVVALGQATYAQSVATSAAPNSVKTGQLEEVVVTAEHRATNLQKTASSITAISGQSIQQTAQANLADVTEGVPALVMQNTSTGFAVAIRGLGLDTSTQLAGPAVASYYDGIYSDAEDGGLIGFYDVNRVEVLRGPQGTLYGRNAEAGVVNIITNDPVLHQFGGNASVGVGNYGLIEANGAINVPLGDNFAPGRHSIPLPIMVISATDRATTTKSRRD